MNDIEIEICAYLRRTHGKSMPVLVQSTQLIGAGLLDSVAILELILHIEAHFGISMPDEETSEENFATVGTLASLIRRLAPTP